MKKKFTLRLRDYIDTPDRKKYYNEQLFTEVAPKYDFITRVLSLGQDSQWKASLMNLLPKVEAPVIVDLACGTGDLCVTLAEKYPDARITGLDLTESMLVIARENNKRPATEFIQADMCQTGLADASVDILTGSYALRNAPDLNEALHEIGRILKPGGVAGFLDFSKSNNPFSYYPMFALLKFWGSVWGIICHGNPQVYSYLSETLALFPDRQQLRKLLLANGLKTIDAQSRYFGLMELIIVKRES